MWRTSKSGCTPTAPSTVCSHAARAVHVEPVPVESLDDGLDLGLVGPFVHDNNHTEGAPQAADVGVGIGARKYAAIGTGFFSGRAPLPLTRREGGNSPPLHRGRTVTSAVALQRELLAEVAAADLRVVGEFFGRALL